MKIVSSPIEGVYSVETTPFQDQLSSFYRAFCDCHLDSLFQGETIRQVNVSRTEAVGVL